MPKEMIRPRVQVRDEAGDLVPQITVQVGWHPDGWVQVGAIAPDIDCKGASLFADLDRRGCNDMIRVLRRARNSAFGGDE